MAGKPVLEVNPLSPGAKIVSGHARKLQPLTVFRRIRRACGGAAAYLFSWWRY